MNFLSRALSDDKGPSSERVIKFMAAATACLGFLIYTIGCVCRDSFTATWLGALSIIAGLAGWAGWLTSEKRSTAIPVVEAEPAATT